MFLVLYKTEPPFLWTWHTTRHGSNHSRWFREWNSRSCVSWIVHACRPNGRQAWRGRSVGGRPHVEERAQSGYTPSYSRPCIHRLQNDDRCAGWRTACKRCAVVESSTHGEGLFRVLQRRRECQYECPPDSQGQRRNKFQKGGGVVPFWESVYCLVELSLIAVGARACWETLDSWFRDPEVVGVVGRGDKTQGRLCTDGGVKVCWSSSWHSVWPWWWLSRDSSWWCKSSGCKSDTRHSPVGGRRWYRDVSVNLWRRWSGKWSHGQSQDSGCSRRAAGRRWRGFSGRRRRRRQWHTQEGASVVGL